MSLIHVTDLSLPALDMFARLTGAQLRRPTEEGLGIFIAESPTVIDVALRSGYKPIACLTDERLLHGAVSALIERLGDIPVYVAEESVLRGLTGFALTRGILCAMRREALPSVESVLKGARRVAVLENITDSTNVGAVFRSAAAFAIDAVLITPSCCDPLCRRALRVSMGTVLQVPYTVIGEHAADWPSVGMQRLRALGFTTCAMALSDDSVSIADPRLRAQERLAIILGTEGDGLCAATVADADYTVKIPMSHGVDSLNVAAAGAVAFWELTK